MAYSEKVLEHFTHPRNVGTLDKDKKNVENNDENEKIEEKDKKIVNIEKDKHNIEENKIKDKKVKDISEELIHGEIDRIANNYLMYSSWFK